MPDPTQFDPDPIRVALDHGEVVELDGGTLVLDGDESPSVVLRLTPWRARSVARVLQQWSSMSRIFRHPTRPHLDELDLSRTLTLAAVAILGEREAQLSVLQRLALVDAAAWWLSEPNGGEELAYALLAATCSEAVTTEHAYLALITPTDEPGDDGEGTSS
jgi:hypothetical protein